MPRPVVSLLGPWIKWTPSAAPFAPQQADSDARLLSLWLHGRPLRRWCGPTGATLGDLQAWLDVLGDLSPSSRKRATAAIKSLLTFAQRIGYLPVNVGAAVKLPSVRDDLAARILDRESVVRLSALEPDQRNRALLKLLYVAGLRVSEAVGLHWRDRRPREDGRGQLAVFGKGGKTRPILLPRAVWRELLALRLDGDDAAPVFRSKRSTLPARQAHAIVVAAARRAGLPEHVSPHWLRHAHASHALDAGTNVHLVRDTLGHASLTTTSRYAHARPGDSSALHLGYD